MSKTKKYPKEFKKYVTNLMLRCLAMTGHGEYSLFTEWRYKKDCSEKSTIKAEIVIDHAYLWCKVIFYPCLYRHWKRKEYSSIAEDLMHEACHLYLEPIVDLFLWDVSQSQKKQTRQTIERQTERICKTIIGLCNDTWYLPETVNNPC